MFQFEPEKPKIMVGCSTDDIGYIYGLEKASPPPPPKPSPIVESRSNDRAVRVDVQIPINGVALRLMYAAVDRAGFVKVEFALPNGEIHTYTLGAKELGALERFREDVSLVANLTSIGGNLGELIDGSDGRWVGSAIGLIAGIGIAANRN